MDSISDFKKAKPSETFINDSLHAEIAKGKSERSTESNASKPVEKSKEENESSKPKDDRKHNGFAYELGHSALYSAVQAPVEGMAQTFDHTLGKPFGTKLYEKSKDLLVSAPQATDFGSAEWHGQTIGGAIGVIPWFMACRGAVRGLAEKTALTKSLVVGVDEAAGAKMFSSTGAKLSLEGGITGAVYAGAIKSVEYQGGEHNYWKAKSGAMVQDFATFGTLTASSLGISGALSKSLAPLAERSEVAGQLVPKTVAITSGALSGIPAAAAELGTQYALSGGESKISQDNFIQSAYSFAVAGSALASFHPSVKRLQPDTKQIVEASESATQLKGASEKQSLPSEAPSELHKVNHKANKQSEEFSVYELGKHDFGKYASTKQMFIFTDQPEISTKSSYELAGNMRSIEAPPFSISLKEAGSHFDGLPTAGAFQHFVGSRMVGNLPKAFISERCPEELAYYKLNDLAEALRQIDGTFPPQKKSGLGAMQIDLPATEVQFGDKQIKVEKIAIGEVAHVYKLSLGHEDYAFKVPTDPARHDIHGSAAETAAFALLSKHKVSNLIDFHAANVGKSGWMLTEFVDRAKHREGEPIEAVLDRYTLKLGDDWSANRGPGNVVWDLGGLEPKNLKSPTTLAKFEQLLQSPEGSLVAGRKVDSLPSQDAIKTALALALEHSDNNGQVPRTAVRLLTDAKDVNEILEKSLEKTGAAGRAAFELDRLKGTPYITERFYQAIANPESRLEAAKSIDKLPPHERYRAFETAFAFGEARPLATRAIPSLAPEYKQAAITMAKQDPGSLYVLMDMNLLKTESASDKERAFKLYLDKNSLSTINDSVAIKRSLDDFAGTNDTKRSEFAHIWKGLSAEQTHLNDNLLENIRVNWHRLSREQWRKLSEFDLANLFAVNERYSLTSEGFNEVADRPDLRRYLAQSQTISEVNVDALLGGMWDKLPPDYKRLEGAEMKNVIAVWNIADKKDWETIPAKEAADLANSIGKLGLANSLETAHLFRHADLRQWVKENLVSLSNESWQTKLLMFGAWKSLTESEKKLSFDELCNKITLKTLGQELSKLGIKQDTLNYILALTDKDLPGRKLMKSIYFALATGDCSENAAIRQKSINRINELANQKGSARDFIPEAIMAHVYLQSLYSNRPDILAKIDSLGLTNWHKYDLGRKLTAEPKQSQEIATRAIMKGWLDQAPDVSRICSLVRLAADAKLNNRQIDNLIALAPSEEKLQDIHHLASEQSAAKEYLKAKLNERPRARDLEPNILADRTYVSQLDGYEPSELAKLGQLADSGLSMVQVSLYSKLDREHPQLLKDLLAENATTAQLKDVMRLSAFPAPLSLAIARGSWSGNYRLQQVLAGLRDYGTGKNFHALLTDHLAQGFQLNRTELIRLQREAKQVGYSFQTEATLPQPRNFLKAADTFLDAADGIERLIPSHQPIVLLGRDAWPLLPILKERGRNAMYFLFSRLQYDDESTKRQWLKEIPPGAAVVDTGFSGSIIKAIKKFDPTIGGYLMSTDGSTFPRLLADPREHRRRVQDLEDLPKLIFRTNRHTENGGAVARRDASSRDGDVSHIVVNRSRWWAEYNARSLLKAAGMPEWTAWRYSTFVGLTPQERLGLSNEQAVQRHYESVLTARQGS
ncbi:MAG: hypothetical protein J0M35_12295 [Candidatus Obscuribacter phosphatis]|uniref:Uncharacterized protein n=1 Tax=Candidatus Obscuribacter phosphatis TaxID=1906157 RepID=A0A8J7TNL8_9BACT|nr:hypothetical protein [Candidatus Obscuribacter phosphatis]